jgi:membrane-associated phospholipid phosphatase
VNVAAFERATARSYRATDPTLWRIAFALVVGVAIAAARLQWTIVWRPVLVNAAGVLALVAVGAFYDRTRRSAALARLGYAIALSTTLGEATLVATYVIGVGGRPFQTEILSRMDAAFGFSWPVWSSWVAARPMFAAVLTSIYAMHLAATAATVGILAFRTVDGATRFLRAFCLAFAMVALGELLLPSLTSTPHAPSNVVRLSLRDGSFSTLDLSHMLGIVCFPSMHAVLGVLVPIALWRFRAWRIPLVVYGIGMCVATISEGGHHLVDVLSGAIVAFAVACVTALSSAAIARDD